MTGEAAGLLLALLLGHYLGDFTPLATEGMQEAKASGGPLVPIAGHAAVHGALTAAAVLPFALPRWELAALAGLVQLGSHLLIDGVRARLCASVAALRDPDHQLFWSLLGADQLAHGSVLVGIALLVQ